MNIKKLKRRLKAEGPKQLFLCIVLIGILPAVEDFSLFAGFGFSITSFQSHEEFGFLYSLSFFTLPIGLILLMGGKNYYRILGLIPVFFAAYLHLMHGILNVSLVAYEGLFGILHFLCYKIAFLYFVVKGKLRSLPFLLTLVVVWILMDFQHLVLLLTYTVLVRFLYFAIVQNINIFKETGLKRSTYLTLKSFLYWSPLLIFIVPSAIISAKMNKAAIDRIYNDTFIVSTDSDRKYKRDQFEKDLEYSVGAEVLHLNEIIQAGTSDVNGIIKDKTDELPQQVAGIYSGIFKPTLPEMAPFFKEEDCGFWGLLNIPCQVKNGAKRGVNNSYRRQRAEMFSSLVKAVRTSANETQEDIDTSTRAINRTLESHVAQFARQLKFVIQSFFDSLLFINILMDIAFGFLILKSFLYVFSRVAFSADDENYATLLSPKSAMTKGVLSKTGNQYTIDPGSNTENFYISRSFEPSGRAPKFSLPQWKAAIMARIFSGNYAMNKVVMVSRPEPVHFKAMGSHEFVEWEIKEDEEVIFSFKNFVGMSEGIKISALISMRLTSLLFGRLIFTTAKGPGKLILLTKGEPITAGDPKAVASISTSRILAWQRNTRFNVESELNLVDVFMSGIYLKKKEDDLVLIDADVKGRAKNGIVRFIKSFVLPI